MNGHLDQLRQLLSDATARIAPEYFLLPIADVDGGEPIFRYRERVYAYELYHQLRHRWPRWPYSLGGEVDKRGHPIIRGGYLDDAKPDLLVHVPGEMNHNLAAIEIKPLRPEQGPSEAASIQLDLLKLIAFRGIGYVGAFFIAFGEPIERLHEYGHRFRKNPVQIDLVEICHHRRPGEAAVFVPW